MTQWQPPPPTERAERLREFDALRGFSMLSVVFVHSLNITGDAASDMISWQIVVSYFMPLFFFISGFFAYKPFNKWEYATYRKLIPQKIKALLVCTLFFYTLRYYLLGANPFGWLQKGFMGYWFTIVLLAMFAIYYFATFIARLINKDVIMVLMIALGLTGPVLIQFGLSQEGRLGTIIGTTNLCFFLQWFVFGLITKKYQVKFEHILSNSSVKALLITSYVIGLCGFYDCIPNTIVVKTISSIVVPYVGVLAITSIFYSFRDFFNGHTHMAEVMCFVGRRTLDIYICCTTFFCRRFLNSVRG